MSASVCGMRILHAHTVACSTSGSAHADKSFLMNAERERIANDNLTQTQSHSYLKAKKKYDTVFLSR